MTRLATLLLAVLLMGAHCGDRGIPLPPDPPPPGPEHGYCAGTHQPQWTDPAIVGGYVSTERRATVRVRFGNALCTGVVISPHTVLTAGHCGYATDDHYIILVEGGGSQIFHTTDQIVHPRYFDWVNNYDSAGREFDLQILHTRNPMPGPYASTFYDSKWSRACSNLVAQGYGKDGLGNSGRLLEVGQFGVVRENEWTIHTRGGDASQAVCFGDSGGPLYAYVDGVDELVLAGITSTTWGGNDCIVEDESRPASTHIKVKAHETWIRENTI